MSSLLTRQPTRPSWEFKAFIKKKLKIKKPTYILCNTICVCQLWGWSGAQTLATTILFFQFAACGFACFSGRSTRQFYTLHTYLPTQCICIEIYYPHCRASGVQTPTLGTTAIQLVGLFVYYRIILLFVYNIPSRYDRKYTTFTIKVCISMLETPVASSIHLTFFTA